MPRISREDRLERSLTDRLQAMIEDPATRCTSSTAAWPRWRPCCAGGISASLRRRRPAPLAVLRGTRTSATPDTLAPLICPIMGDLTPAGRQLKRTLAPRWPA